MKQRFALITILLLLLGGLVTPTQAQSDEPPPDTTIYIVQRGDTLRSIAQRHGSTVDAITHANGIPDPRQIYLGQRLVIPGATTGLDVTDTIPYVFQVGDTLTSIAQRYRTTWQMLAQANKLLSPNVLYAGQVIQVPSITPSTSHNPDSEDQTALPAKSDASYIVRPQDTMLRIALKYGISPWTLSANSHVGNPALIFPGQMLTAPGLGEGDHPLPDPFASVTVQPLPVAQGTMMLITVHATEPITLTGRLFEQRIPFAEEGGIYYGLMGVHVFTKPGLYELELTALDRQARPTVISTGVVVEAGHFYYERIDVPAGRTNLLDPAAIARDRERLDAARLTFTPDRQWTVPFERPCTGSISAYFGSHRSYNGGPYTSYHSGVDFRVPGGTPVHAAAAGTVVLAEPLTLWGNAVVVDHGWGVVTGYAHLSKIEVEVGQRVERGELIARVGNTGLSTGSHLHWEMWVNGTSVNGLQWLEDPSTWLQVEWLSVGG